MAESISFEFDEELFEELKLLRMELADWNPAYVVATNETLMLLATVKPLTKQWFLSIDGLKQKRYESYWEEILSLIRTHLKGKWVDVKKLENLEREKFQKIEEEKEKMRKIVEKSRRNLREREIAKLTKKTYKNKYQYWVDNYPWYVVIKLEWYFRTARWEYAELLHDLLWYKVVDNDFWKFTWSPVLENITNALEDWRYDYIVVENEECIIEKTF